MTGIAGAVGLWTLQERAWHVGNRFFPCSPPLQGSPATGLLRKDAGPWAHEERSDVGYIGTQGKVGSRPWMP